MKTWYVGHDKAYKKRKADGYEGWDTSADGYDEAKTKLDMIFGYGRAPKSGRLLELGCGAGNVTVWLAGKGYDTYGIDIAPTVIAWAREKAGEQGVNVQFSVGSVLELNTFSNDFFDFVLDGHCLHCIIGEDRRQLFSSVYRVLRPGGYFLVDTMCGPVNPKLVENFDPVSGCTIHNGISSRYYGLPDSIRDEIVEAGFQILHWEIKKGDSNGCLTVEAVKPE
ncbi:MAG: methyltransferase domain-containing protein [Candidatus Aegiribacteria sp.]|nr:methyltransferase domain-containing protein [Candidatus Aegiribacteria sp.]